MGTILRLLNAVITILFIVVAVAVLTMFGVVLVVMILFNKLLRKRSLSVSDELATYINDFVELLADGRR